jgi:hypothetical protein
MGITAGRPFLWGSGLFILIQADSALILRLRANFQDKNGNPELLSAHWPMLNLFH